MTLKESLAQIEKQFGKGTITKLGEATGLAVDIIPTGCLPLDVALGIGGMPRGRISEIFGPEATAKTTLVLQVMANAQRAGGTVAFIDAEQAFPDVSYAKALGVDVDSLYLCQPDYGEQGLEVAGALIASGEVDVVAVDSVAALVPRAEIEGEMGDAHVGGQARLMSQAMRKLAGIVRQSNTALVFTNQLREKIGIFYGNPEVTPGGRALKFYASARIELRRIEDIKDGDQKIGAKIRARVVKNKLAAPHRTAEFALIYGRGIDRQGGALDAGIGLGIVRKAGSHYSLGEMKLGKSRDEAVEFLSDNPKVLGEIESTARELLRKRTEI